MDEFYVLEIIKPCGTLTGVYLGSGRDFAYTVAKAKKFRTKDLAELVRNEKAPHFYRAVHKTWDADLIEEENARGGF
jgi:hypothetical protein